MAAPILDTVIDFNGRLMRDVLSTPSMTADDDTDGPPRTHGVMPRGGRGGRGPHRAPRDEPYPQSGLALSPVHNHHPPGDLLGQLMVHHLDMPSGGSGGSGSSVGGAPPPVYMPIEDAFAAQQLRTAERMTQLIRDEAQLLAHARGVSAPSIAPFVVAPMGTAEHEKQCVLCHMDMLEVVPRVYEEFVDALREKLHEGKTPEATALFGSHYFAEHVQPLLDDHDDGPATPGACPVPVYHTEVVAMHIAEAPMYTLNSELDNTMLLRKLQKTRALIEARIIPANPSEGIDIKAGELNLKYTLAIMARNDKELKRPRQAHANLMAAPGSDMEALSPALRRQRRRPPSSSIASWIDQHAHSTEPT
jgi:hypothetical protein